MYEPFFGFRERPFDLTSNPRYLVLTEGHREAIANIEYAITSRKGITLLTGAAGCGKTTVVRAAIERQPTPVSCVYLHNPALTRAEFIEMIGTCFGLSQRARESKTALLLELEVLLRRRYRADETTVLIVDEAQTLPLSLLEEIRLLANIETNEEKLLSIVLAGQPELLVRLDDPSMSQLKQRITLSCELRPLTLDQTAAYVLSRVQSAGGVATDVFTLEAVTLIHEAARGVPRAINVIAENALITAFATEQRPVTSEIVLEVCRDFRTRQQHHDTASVANGRRQSAEYPSSSAGVLNDGEGGWAQFSRSLRGPDRRPEPSIFKWFSRKYLRGRKNESQESFIGERAGAAVTASARGRHLD